MQKSPSTYLLVNYDQLTYLGAKVTEKSGEPWSLHARFLTDADWLQTKHHDQIVWQLGNEVRRGYVASWCWHTWNRNHGIVEIEAGPLPAAATRIRRKRVVPSDDGLKGLIEHVFGNAQEWNISPLLQVPAFPAQWIQYEETDWEFATRIVKQISGQIDWEAEQNHSQANIRIFAKQNEEPQQTLEPAFWNSAIINLDAQKQCTVQGHTAQKGLSVNMGIQVPERYSFTAGCISHCEHSIDLEGSILGVGPVAPYGCQLSIIDTSAQPIPKKIFLQRPLLQGTLAHPKGSAENAPFLFDDGSYAVELPWGEHGMSVWGKVRMLQSYVAPQGGIHCALLPGSAVLLGFEQDQPDQPLILGALPDSQHPSPGDPHHADRQIFRNQAGSSILFEGDSLKLSAGKASLLFQGNPPRIELCVAQARVVFDEEKALKIIADNITIEASNNLDLKGQLINLN